MHCKPLLVVFCAFVLTACATAPVADRLELPAGGLTRGERIALAVVMPCAVGLEDPRDCSDADPSRAQAALDLPGVERQGLIFGSIATGAHAATAAAIGRIDNAPLVAASWTRPITELLAQRGFVAVPGEVPFLLPSALPEGGKASGRSAPVPESYSGRVGNGGAIREAYHDFGAIAVAADARHVMVLEVLRHGVDRVIGGFGVPLTRPYAVAALRVYLESPGAVDAGSAEQPLFSMYIARTREVAEADEETQRRELVEAVGDALAGAIEEARSRVAVALPAG